MDSFNPTVRCPYCQGVNRPSITGWGREGLNNRIHDCKHCSKSYIVVAYVETSKELDIADGYISNIRSKIKFLKRGIKEMKLGLLNTRAEFAKEYIRREASTAGKQN